MRLLKSVLAGVLAVVIAEVALIACSIIVPLVTTAFEARKSGGGIGSIGVVLNAGVLLVMAVVAGIAGFLWQWRRSRPTPA